jgi:CubicO group peptidase (beta-lactamase class C family)
MAARTEMRSHVGGHVAAGFEAVRETFAEGLREVGEGGAAFAAVLDGKLVVDVWGGRAGDKPWAAHTRAVLMSATKGVATIAVARLVDRGLLDVDAPAADYWPELAAAGKAQVTVAQVLCHSAGLVTIPGYTDFIGPAGDGWERTDEILRRLESASPEWPPGSASGYHGLTFELDLGTPVERQHLVAPVIVAGSRLTNAVEDALLADPSSLFSKMVLSVEGHSVLDTADRVFADPGRLAIELPGSNATGTARALARLYGALAADGRSDGLELLPPAVIDTFAAQRMRGPSRLTGAEERWGLGFARPCAAPNGVASAWGPHDEAFGHAGLGGQIAFADPVSRVGIGVVRSHLSATSPLGSRLIDVFYGCL